MDGDNTCKQHLLKIILKLILLIIYSKEYKTKLILTPYIKTLVDDAKIKYFGLPKHYNKKFPYGFNNYQGNLKLDGIFFRYIVRIGKTKNRNVFYDVSLDVLS